MIKKRKNRVEEQNQMVFVDWFRRQYPRYAKLLTLGSFGENVGKIRMARLKQMGLTPGYPDLFFAMPNHFCLGLFIEMKTKTGKASEEQLEIHSLLRGQNYEVHICRSFEDAQRTMIWYLNL